MLNANVDNTKKKLRNTTEHGQILMTCTSIYEKFKNMKNMISSTGEMQRVKEPKNFDSMTESAKFAQIQLKILQQVVKSIREVNQNLKDDPEMKKKIAELKAKPSFDPEEFKLILEK